jgi:Flp pilus assembly protein protease CpaA
MVTLALLMQSLWIAVIDIRSHRISNISILVLALPLFVRPHSIAPLDSFFGLIALLAVALISRMGGGDFKLLSLLIISQGEIVVSLHYIFMALVLASGSAFFTVARQRNFGVSVPLAPSILVPFLLIYLDI